MREYGLQRKWTTQEHNRMILTQGKDNNSRIDTKTTSNNKVDMRLKSSISSYSIHDVVMWLQFIKAGDQTVDILRDHGVLLDGCKMLHVTSKEEHIQELELKSRHEHLAMLALTRYRQVLYKEVELLQLENEMLLNYLRKLDSEDDMEYSILNDQRHTIISANREDIRPDKCYSSLSYAG